MSNPGALYGNAPKSPLHAPYMCSPVCYYIIWRGMRKDGCGVRREDGCGVKREDGCGGKREDGCGADGRWVWCKKETWVWCEECSVRGNTGVV